MSLHNVTHWLESGRQRVLVKCMEGRWQKSFVFLTSMFLWSREIVPPLIIYWQFIHIQYFFSSKYVNTDWSKLQWQCLHFKKYLIMCYWLLCVCVLDILWKAFFGSWIDRLELKCRPNVNRMWGHPELVRRYHLQIQILQIWEHMSTSGQLCHCSMDSNSSLHQWRKPNGAKCDIIILN